ncbi:MAG: Na+/H+ antiporter subunit E [Rhodospirillales bacterium]
MDTRASDVRNRGDQVPAGGGARAPDLVADPIPRSSGGWLQAASATVILFIFWLLLSGHYIPFLIGAGLLSSVLVVLACRRMGVMDDEGHPIHLTTRALTYWPWLLWEIAKAAWDVTKIVWHPRLPISPTLIRVTASQRTAVGIATYANSITLTPGTISVEVEGNEILVHAVTEAGAEGTAAGDMDRRVTRFEGAA